MGLTLKPNPRTYYSEVSWLNLKCSERTKSLSFSLISQHLSCTPALKRALKKSTYIFFWDFLSSFEKMSVAHGLWIRFGHNLQIAPPKESFSHLKKGVSSPHLLRASKASSVFNDRPVWSKEKIVRRLKENLSVRPSII